MTSKRTEPDDATDLDFQEKSSDLDFDPWGSEDDDVARRRDPLRKRSSAAAPVDSDEGDLI